MKSSLEIAQEAKLKDIGEVASVLDLKEEDLERYGNSVAKINLSHQRKEEIKKRSKGKYILVTATSPTRSGEGKTTTSIGLTQGLSELGKKAVVTLRQPSLGPVFGIKGGAAGAGFSQVLPMEEINLGLTGDISKVEAAHNLAAAMLDNYIFRDRDSNVNTREPLNFDVTTIQYRRVMDMNDRALREVVIALGDQTINGLTRKSGFDITAASEIMAILALAKDITDLKERIGKIVLGRDKTGEIITIADINANGAMAAILKHAMKPNLVQTIEGSPAMIHAGPFANIAHGCSSIVADDIALRLADYVVTEAGFGSDLGAEKFFDIKCRQSGQYPNAVVVVTTIKALKLHGGVSWDRELIKQPDTEAVRKGLVNLDAHIENMKQFDVPVVVALNKFESDTDEEIEVVRNHVEEVDNVSFAISEGVVKGGEGTTALAQKVIDAAESNPNPEHSFIYDLEDSIENKIRTIAQNVYGADDIELSKKAKNLIKNLEEDGFGDLAVCIAKTHMSLSDDASLIGRPEGFKIHVEDVRISAGAGFIYPIVGKMLTMPGLPAVPAAENIDIDENGKITGLF